MLQQQTCLSFFFPPPRPLHGHPSAATLHKKSEGLQGGKAALREYKAATHHYHTDRNSFARVCTVGKNTQNKTVAARRGGKSCAGLCRLVP